MIDNSCSGFQQKLRLILSLNTCPGEARMIRPRSSGFGFQKIHLSISYDSQKSRKNIDLHRD